MGLEKNLRTKTDKSSLIRSLERKVTEQRKTIRNLEEVLRRRKPELKEKEREYNEKIEDYLSQIKGYKEEVETLGRYLSEIVTESARKDRAISKLTANLNKARKIIGNLLTDKLHELVIEQREELKSEQFQPILSGTEDELFGWYKESDMFKQAYKEFKGYLPLTDEEFDKRRAEFAGRVLQDIAYNFFVGMQSRSTILLSPKRTLNFYRKLHLDKPVIKEPFGLDSIEGVSVPDGMVVKEHEGRERIVKVYEYTLEKDYSYFKKKDDGFIEEMEYLKRFLGDYFQQLFGDAYLLFVVPRGRDSDKLRNKDLLPFIHKQFEDFIRYVYYNYKPTEDSKTLFDIQKKRI